MSVLSPTLKLVISKTLPLTVGLFAIMAVQLVDSIFIGMLGVEQLAVHGITLPFQTALIGIQVGIGVAATSIISQARGAKLGEKASAVASLAVAFGGLLISLVCVALWASREWVFAGFVSSELSLQQYHALQAIFNRYWPLWLLSALSVAVLYLSTCVYRANGDTKTTGQMFLLASIINLVLDPLLIFGLDMGIVGAPLASFIGYALCAGYMLSKARDSGWFRSPLGGGLGHFAELVRVAIPTTANQLLPSASAFVGMMLIAELGTDAIAFWSLLSRSESFLLVFTLALTMSIPPMIGHALGEGKPERINQLLYTTAKFLLLYHSVVALLLVLGKGVVIPLISAEPVIQNWFGIALWIIPLSYGPLGLCMVVVSVFNALGAPNKALLVSLVRLFGLYVPAIGIGTSMESLPYTLAACSLANILAGLFAWHTLRTHLNTPTNQGENYAIGELQGS